MIDLAPYLADLNATGHGWEDSYWHNDACQSVHFEYSTSSRLKLWIDAADPAERECSVGGRFILVFQYDEDVENEEPAFTETMMITDDWQAIVELVAETHGTVKHYQDAGRTWR